MNKESPEDCIRKAEKNFIQGVSLLCSLLPMNEWMRRFRFMKLRHRFML